MASILAVVPVWQRPRVARACFESLQRVCVEGECIASLACVSPGDTQVPASSMWFWTENNPLGQKHNALLRYARDVPWDYIWVLNSDSIVTPGILDLYRPLMEQGAERIGLKDLWLYDTQGKQLYYFGGYTEGRSDSLGTGRMIHRSVVEACGWELWDNQLNRGLDHISTMRMDAVGTRETLISQHGTGEYLLELRTDEQLTSMSDWVRAGARPVPPGNARVRAMLASTPWAY